MVDKLEAGKTYRCIDLEGYLGDNSIKKELWHIFSSNGNYTLHKLDTNGAGLVCGYMVISLKDMKYFELVEDSNESPKTTGRLKLSLNNLTLSLTCEEAQDIVDDLTAQLKDIYYGGLDGAE